jgi:Ca-activated chloride channel family protein
MKSMLFTIISGLLILGFTSIVPDRVVRGVIMDDHSAEFLSGVHISYNGTSIKSVTDSTGKFEMIVPGDTGFLVISAPGYKTQNIRLTDKEHYTVRLRKLKSEKEVIQEDAVYNLFDKKNKNFGDRAYSTVFHNGAPAVYSQSYQDPQTNWNTEDYDIINENRFLDAVNNPLSTFSIDVDGASYSNLRRFIQNGQKPPVDAVRIEEMVNYFNYDYSPPTEHPFSVYTELAACPWSPKHKLVHIGLQGKKISTENLPASNLVFLLDVSGSMDQPNKLPLVKSSFRLLLNNLREQDRVAIVVYAGAAGLVLPSTPGNQKEKILEALDHLHAGGSTAGSAGIKLAYQTAVDNLIKGGNNRVILATDGDFNVGTSSDAELIRIIEKEREKGVFLTVLGFGTGNYKDNKMQKLANSGNGNHGYIDNILEAKKVFINEFGGTLFTIAKDVKIQVEFNPEKVQAYRLIGYENRLLNKEDFNDDKKDAGEIGSGHTVTALYEVIPVGIKSKFIGSVDDLRYQKTRIDKKGSGSDELVYVKIRYKQPDGNVSKLISQPIADRNLKPEKSSANFRWAAAVASFGMLLRDSEFLGDASYEMVESLAQGARGEDIYGYRNEFIHMIQSMRLVAGQ